MMFEHINPITGAAWIDDVISRRARKLGLMKYERDWEYELFDRAGYINACIDGRRTFVITWVPSFIRLHCRHYRDIYGISDIVGIEEIVTLFAGVKGVERFRIFLIPYLITGMDIPPELEQ